MVIILKWSLRYTYSRLPRSGTAPASYSKVRSIQFNPHVQKPTQLHQISLLNQPSLTLYPPLSSSLFPSPSRSSLSPPISLCSTAPASKHSHSLQFDSLYLLAFLPHLKIFVKFSLIFCYNLVLSEYELISLGKLGIMYT